MRKGFLFFCCVLLFIPSLLFGARIKDMAYVYGVRPNQLVGYGLVVGLNGTGDRITNTLFMGQSLANMLEKMGIKIDPRQNKVQNVAAVLVTADLPPFARRGSRIDVTVSSIGDAKSLGGGTLVMTPLRGADGEVYAIAQGPLIVGGYLAQGAAAAVTKNHPTVARIPNGAMVERELAHPFGRSETFIITLKSPDFTNAKKIVDAVNNIFEDVAEAKDGGTISVRIPDAFRANPVKFLSIVENLEINPDTYAKIVVDEKTGTIVIGENVRISTVAISHGNISIVVKETPEVSQPMPFGRGETAIVPRTEAKVEEERGHFFVLKGGVTIKELVDALNALGVSTRDVIVILEAMKAAGALHAEIEVL